ncbi:MAG TPA: ABC-2 family transporter protein [Thermoanaerobaculia bacterium]|nr:ABC-2 family transporter protein [Thermoanaerobaculia bacterium]
MTPATFAAIAGGEARKLMSYRADFWISTLVAFMVRMAVAWFLWDAIFASTGRTEIAGFSREGMVLYYVLVLLIGKVVSGEERQVSIAQDIYEGRLSRYLLFPGGYFSFKYAEHLGQLVPVLAQLVLFGSWAALVFDLESLGSVSAGSVARAAVAVAVGNLLAFLIAFLTESVAFWADNVWSLNVLLRFVAHLLGGEMLPLELFPAWARLGLDLLPFRFLFHFPAMTLVGRIDAQSWVSGLAIALGWCLVLTLVARVVWRRGTLVYTGVGI